MHDPAARPAAFDTTPQQLKARSGLAIGPDKLYLLETRLAPILKQQSLRDLTALAEQLRAPRTDIIGTDIARDQLTRARDGLYTQFKFQRDLQMQLLMKYFKKETNGWRIAEPLRRMVDYREFNLLTDLRPLGRSDIVFCRNVLIYFDQPTKARVLSAIAGLPLPDGLLYLGGTETVVGITSGLVPLAGERGVYGLAPASAAVA